MSTRATSLCAVSALTLLACLAQAAPDSLGVSNAFIKAQISLQYPGFSSLSVDSLGRQGFPAIVIKAPHGPVRPTTATAAGSRVEYRRPGASAAAPARWAIAVNQNEIRMDSTWSPEDPPEPLVIDADNRACHATLLGRLETNGAIDLPAILHLPDQGSFQISATAKGAALGYAAQGHDVKITFPAATEQHRKIRYTLRLAAICPKAGGTAGDPRFDAFRRDWLNIFQISPRWRMLANHAASDTCAFCYYEYADIAVQTPRLTGNFAAIDMVRQTLEVIMAGGNAYGMPGHGAFPEYSSDTLPSLLIAAADYIQASKDRAWSVNHYDKLKSWTDTMLATDRAGNGLIEYILSGNSGSWPEVFRNRPANWWDTIGFGHEDAYANALAYRALLDMKTVAKEAGHPGDAARYGQAAEKLRAAYFDAFYNPATGVLAGWRSADGQLHDYYFPWVSGIAIHYGLVPREKANTIMDRLLAKMKEVGYSRFDLGLPGNLIPVARKDYVSLDRRWGGGSKPDNSDCFQIYENGGATACFEYFTLSALYDLGRIEDGDRLLMPLLGAFDAGAFQGHGNNGMSKDWKTWDGTCWGYEGFLVDNYYALLAVIDRDKALRQHGR